MVRCCLGNIVCQGAGKESWLVLANNMFVSSTCGRRFCSRRKAEFLCAQAQVGGSETKSLLTCLLEGPSGVGKSALAATLGLIRRFLGKVGLKFLCAV